MIQRITRLSQTSQVLNIFAGPLLVVDTPPPSPHTHTHTLVRDWTFWRIFSPTMQVIVSFLLTETTANNHSNHNCTVYIHMLTIYPTAHSGIQKYLFKTFEMTVNNETTTVNCWLGLACVSRKWCAQGKIPN